MKPFFAFLSLVLLLVCCKEVERDSSSYDTVALSLPDKKMYKEKSDYGQEVNAVASEVVEEVVDAATPPVNSIEKIDQKIIKTGNLRFETSDMEETFVELQHLIKKHKAIVQNDSEEKTNNTVNRYLTLRIPNQNFDSFITELSSGVHYFDLKNISVDDVTEEYIDVASRIKTKKALEERYLELLKKANKVSEMLEIERELASIREEIEAKEGRLKYIQNSVSMSTINVEFYKVMERKVGASVSFGTKFVNALKSGFNGISTFFLWVIEVWPFIIILVALIFYIRKRFKKKNSNKNVDKG
ncbi:MAG: DUF4349 domain-containing protein [Flavobacterium sp.]|nr:DUF4349 domain-containing protein [Flavobacterium sp.]